MIGNGKDGWRRLQAVAISASTAEGLTLAVLPLLAVSITTDPREVSWVNVAGQSPWLLFSLFAGVLIDRVRRTTVLAWAFGIEVVATLALGTTGSAHLLSLPLLMVVAFVLTSAQVLGDGASGALVPEVVPPDRLTAANTRLQLIDRGVVQFVVPPVTGWLVAVGAGLPAWVACVAAALALLLVRGIPSAPVVPSQAHPLRDLREGLRYLVRTPLLRSITVTVALGSFAASADNSMLVLYATQVLHLGPVGYGALLACLAAGWILSSFVVHRIVARFGYSWSMRVSQTLAAVTSLLIAVVPPWPVVVGAVLLFTTAVVLVWNVCSQSSRQRFTPRALLGRVLTSHRALAWGLTPLGALAGGLVAAHWSLRGVWFLGAVIHGIGAVIVWRSLSPAAFREAEAAEAAGAS
ncbi:MFS family permease [Amycolatopsis bartoniae]|uniref:MFS transporter n=1 Tax=Amycolatopsis bartoniae TaxID=941986 RepID=A0A8H9INF1_9PSEU|nr:MFS transporter [Amycolatopsis bartoniae]MBB2939294.1 MFS family permease [Amycolatopsis bartoniae]GHF37516.1 MFS transporter [Amycolatopsis bartoniae]